MKTIFLLLISALLFASACDVNAQITRTKTMSASTWIDTYEGRTKDTVSVNADSVFYYVLTANKADDLFYDIKIALDSLGATPNYVIDLKAKVFPDDDWTSLETDVTWTGTSSDTTIRFTEQTTAEFYRIFRVEINGQAGTGKAGIGKIQTKFWP